MFWWTRVQSYLERYRFFTCKCPKPESEPTISLNSNRTSGIITIWVVIFPLYYVKRYCRCTLLTRTSIPKNPDLYHSGFNHIICIACHQNNYTYFLGWTFLMSLHYWNMFFLQNVGCKFYNPINIFIPNPRNFQT